MVDNRPALGPPIGGIEAEADDGGIGAFFLAIGGKHAARPPAAAMRSGAAVGVNDPDGDVACGQFGRDRQTENACAEDGDGRGHSAALNPVSGTGQSAWKWWTGP